MIDYKTREDRIGEECDGWCYVQIAIIALAVAIIIAEFILG